MYAGSIRSVERGAYAARTTSRRTLGILVDAPRQRCASHAAVRAGRLRVLCGDLQEQDGGRDRYWRCRSQRKCLEFHLRASHPRRPRRAEGQAMTLDKRTLLEAWTSIRIHYKLGKVRRG